MILKKIIKQFKVLIILVMVFSINTLTVEAQSNPNQPSGTLSEDASQAPVKEITPIRTEKIDKAGEKISDSIDMLGKKASSQFGGWINTNVVAGISWIKLLACLLLIFVVVVIERTVRWLILKQISVIPKKEGVISWTRLILKAIIKPVSLFIWAYGIYAALSPLYGHFQTNGNANLVYLVTRKAAEIGGTFALFWFVYQLVAVIDARLVQWTKTTENTIDDQLVPLFGKTLRVFIVIIAGIIVIQNLTGIEIGPLLASLGIGGLAVALAAKDSIANFFGTLTILFDKPFQVGERVVIDKYDGVVERVGFRSTQIRLLTGHLVTIPNEKLVNSGLENIGKRPYIRWLTNIGVTYDTPPDKVEKAVQLIKDILENHEGMHPDFPFRVYFNGFNDWSLNIMVIVWYHPPNYWDYMAFVQRTCLEIMNKFKAEDIDFAFPSQTFYMANDDKRQLKVMLMNQDKYVSEVELQEDVKPKA